MTIPSPVRRTHASAAPSPSPRPAQRRERPIWSLLLLGGLLSLGACFGESGAESPGSASSGAARAASEDDASTAVRQDIRDLITAVTPLAAEVPVNEQSAWFNRRRQMLVRLRAAGEAHALEALRTYREREDAFPEIRAGLLDVAAHGAPEETLPVLLELVNEYGADLHLRKKAVEYLGATNPEAAVETLGAILTGKVRGRTFPPEEIMLQAWSEAAAKLEIERAALLCDLALDIKRENAVRHLATRLLAEEAGPQSRQALERLVVESTGNSYVRRKAMQSLQQIAPREEFCALVDRIFEREADTNFQVFLDNVRLTHCR